MQSQGKGQEKELQVDKCEVVGTCDPEVNPNQLYEREPRANLFVQLYPIQKQALSTEHLRENVHLRPRVDSIASMLRVRQCAVDAIHDYFRVRPDSSQG